LGESDRERVEVSAEISSLIAELRTLTKYLNHLFEQSFTTTGRLKVVNIPVTIGDAAEAERQYLTSITQIPTLLRSLTDEIKQTRETLERLVVEQAK
jgi:hypothetical protein